MVYALVNGFTPTARTTSCSFLFSSFFLLVASSRSFCVHGCSEEGDEKSKEEGKQIIAHLRKLYFYYSDEEEQKDREKKSESKKSRSVGERGGKGEEEKS